MIAQHDAVGVAREVLGADEAGELSADGFEEGDCRLRLVILPRAPVQLARELWLRWLRDVGEDRRQDLVRQVEKA